MSDIGDIGDIGDVPVDGDTVDAVEAWRARGAADSQPVAFSIVDGLVRRAAAQHGEARRLMLRRVEQRLAAHLGELGAAPDRGLGDAGVDPRPAPGAALSSLSQLVDRLGRAPWSRESPSPIDATKSGLPAAPPPPPAAPNAVTAFKGTWSRLRADQRLRQALSQVPAMAGPLNSSHVVNRALRTMRDLSPEYFDAFMAQVDALLWLERASGGDLPVRSGTARGGRRAPRTPG